MNVLIKPDGTIVEVNDNSLEYALSIGWIKKDKKVKHGNSTNTNKRRTPGVIGSGIGATDTAS